MESNHPFTRNVITTLNGTLDLNSPLIESNNPLTRNVITTLNPTLDFNSPLRPPYYIEIWYYKNVDTESIQKAISNFDCSKVFRNKNANENYKLLTNTVMNIFRNYIPP